MTILSAMQSAAIRLFGQKPSVFFGASQKFELELTDLVNEVAQDVAKYQDWQALTKIASLAGGAAEYPLPADFDRQLLDSDMQRGGSYLWGYSHIANINDFTASQDSGWSGPGGWIIYGNKIRFSPASIGEAQFPYISKNYALGADNTAKPAFDADSDAFILPERMLTLGLVWRWREQKKLDATGDQEAFIKALDEYGAKDRGSSIIRRNGSRRWGDTSVPYSGVAW